MALPCSAQTQAASPPEDWVGKLAGLDAPPDLDLAALRQQALDRIKSRADAAPLKRPPVATQLLKLPQLVAEIQFDEDAAVLGPNLTGCWGVSPIRSPIRRCWDTNS